MGHNCLMIRRSKQHIDTFCHFQKICKSLIEIKPCFDPEERLVMHPASLFKKPSRGPKPARWGLLRGASGTEGVNHSKGEVGGAVPESHVVCAGKRRR